MSDVRKTSARQSGLEDRPLVSAVVPACNAERYVERTIESLLAQSYENLEVLVIDDGSVDRTGKLVEAITNRDDRVVLIRLANSGVAAARNVGVARARGSFIAPVDADDVWLPHAMEQLVARLSSLGPHYGVAYGWSASIDAEGRPTGRFRAATIEGDVFATLICHNFLGNASCSMIRKECFEAIGGYDTAFREYSEQGCEDWDFYVRLAERYRFCVVPGVVVGYRKVAGRMSSEPERMAASHAHMLENVHARHPELPRFFSSLSTSSFYLYLARESEAPKNRIWLRRAFTSSPLFCLIRPGFYGAWIASLLSRRDTGGSGRATGEPARSTGVGTPLALHWSAGRRFRLWLMLVRQRILHAILSAWRASPSKRQSA